MNAGTGLDPDAAVVLGLAATAMPFARNRQAEAERWLRILRLHGESGLALTALGVSEAPLSEAGRPDEGSPPDEATSERDTISLVTEQAVQRAGQRGRQAVDTTDVLLAVMQVYGESFDRVLEAHGTDRAEVLERLGTEPSGPADA